MKNLFGVAPSATYGWPKSRLQLNGIDQSTLDINAAVPAHFVIADGIIGMDGNEPLHGSPRDLGRDRIGRRSRRRRFRMLPADGSQPRARELPGASG
jgi:hypothetical protein